MSKVLIVTGGSRGIGAAVCRLAAQDGWDVAVNYAGNKDAAEAVAADVRSAGRKAVVIQGDMAKEADVIAVFEKAQAELGSITGLAANAGITGKITKVADMTVAAMQEVVGLNVVGLMIQNREAVRRMSTKLGGTGGVIVNTSSIAARLGAPNEFTHYAASKGAVDSWTRGIAREVAGEGVRVCAVAPGMIDTEIHASAGAPDRAARLGSTVPIGRAGSAEEVAQTIVWLLSDKASYTGGAILEVSGGR
jgi:NAD(P)-dependent dehydrogenase (short-subunit alcohol dehydrogenase family)